MKNNILELRQFIEKSKAVLVYFSANNCSVCQVLMPKIKSTFEKDFPKIEQVFINSSENIELSSSFEVFSNPTILIFFEGKEFYRLSRNVSVIQLVDNVKRPYEMLFKENN